jgi:hypothetical protein
MSTGQVRDHAKTNAKRIHWLSNFDWECRAFSYGNLVILGNSRFFIKAGNFTADFPFGRLARSDLTLKIENLGK